MEAWPKGASIQGPLGTRADLIWERKIEVGGGHRLMAKGWGCPSWAVIPLSWTPLTISLFLDLGVDLAHCSL